jgi:secondary thiamine-phosphate synthase enzyme
MQVFTLRTTTRSEMFDITHQVRVAVRVSRVTDGVCHVYVPHTTAGVTINEGADPDVRRDALADLDRLIPWAGNFAHREGNSAAHIKAILVGPSVQVLVEDGELRLGTWQAIFFCEFDGPREREVWTKVCPGA